MVLSCFGWISWERPWKHEGKRVTCSIMVLSCFGDIHAIYHERMRERVSCVASWYWAALVNFLGNTLSQSMSHVRLGSIDWTTPHTYHIYTGDLSQTYATNIKYVSLSEDIPSDMTWVIHDNHPAVWETAPGKSTSSAFWHASFFQIFWVLRRF